MLYEWSLDGYALILSFWYFDADRKTKMATIELYVWTKILLWPTFGLICPINIREEDWNVKSLQITDDNGRIMMTQTHMIIRPSSQMS
jgi:hypothetical protein